MMLSFSFTPVQLRYLLSDLTGIDLVAIAEDDNPRLSNLRVNIRAIIRNLPLTPRAK